MNFSIAVKHYKHGQMPSADPCLSTRLSARKDATNVHPQLARFSHTTTGQCHTKLPPDCCPVGAEAAHQGGRSSGQKNLVHQHP